MNSNPVVEIYKGKGENEYRSKNESIESRKSTDWSISTSNNLKFKPVISKTIYNKPWYNSTVIKGSTIRLAHKKDSGKEWK